MVEEAPDSWTALWDERYSGKILMINNPRDAFAIAQSILGMDYNTDAPAAWRTAAELLKEQKRVNPNYVNDEVFLKMESGEAALAPYFVGDYLTMKENNPDLAFVYPKEGVNYFFDSACILKIPPAESPPGTRCPDFCARTGSTLNRGLPAADPCIPRPFRRRSGRSARDSPYPPPSRSPRRR